MLHIVDHPLIQDKLTRLRQKHTSKHKFKQLLKEISLLMGYEVTRHLPMKMTQIETPLMAMDSPILGQDLAVIAILRAGFGMTEGLLKLAPRALEGHIGLYRDPITKRPVQYMCKLPKPENRLFLLVDPMLATGYSLAMAVDILKDHGVSGENIRVLSLVVAPEGVDTFFQQHPDIDVYTAALDQGLDEKSYIIPGLGDV